MNCGVEAIASIEAFEARIAETSDEEPDAPGVLEVATAMDLAIRGSGAWFNDPGINYLVNKAVDLGWAYRSSGEHDFSQDPTFAPSPVVEDPAPTITVEAVGAALVALGWAVEVDGASWYKGDYMADGEGQQFTVTRGDGGVRASVGDPVAIQVDEDAAAVAARINALVPADAQNDERRSPTDAELNAMAMAGGEVFNTVSKVKGNDSVPKAAHGGARAKDIKSVQVNAVILANQFSGVATSVDARYFGYFEKVYKKPDYFTSPPALAPLW